MNLYRYKILNVKKNVIYKSLHVVVTFGDHLAKWDMAKYDVSLGNLPNVYFGTLFACREKDMWKSIFLRYK